MTTIQRIAQVFGWVFVVIAVWGAFISGTSMAADPALAPKIWGLFPVNFVHNLVHLTFGVWGILAARSSHDAARTYAVAAGAIYVVLSVLGVFFPTGFGMVPLGGADIWLHAVIGVVLLVAGLTLASATTAGDVGPAETRTVMPPPSEGAGDMTAAPPEAAPPEPPAPPEKPRESAGEAGEAGDEPPRRPEKPGGSGERPL